MADKYFTHHGTCPLDKEYKEIEIIYTEKDDSAVFWKHKPVKEFCDKEDTCPKRRGEPLRCPLLLAAPRFLPK